MGAVATPSAETINPPARHRGRWWVAALLFSAMAFNYFDRQMLAVLKPSLSAELKWSEMDYANMVFWFQAAYATSYLMFGAVVDRLGARIGLAVAFVIWSVAQMAHGFARSAGEFMMARALLGIGEGGGYPAGLAAIAAWFDKQERAFATGLFNAGVNVGAIVTPLIVPVVVGAYGWRAAFVATGLASMVWLAFWLIFYRRPNVGGGIVDKMPVEETPELSAPIAWSRILRMREAWAFAIGKMLIDPVFWMFLFWLPDFLHKRHGLELKTFGLPLAAIYIMSDAGSILGGWASSALIKRGVSVNRARKLTMLVCALLALPVIIAVNISNLWLAVAIIGLAGAAHQGFSVNLFTLPSDLFPKRAVGRVIGMGGAMGAIGGMAMSQYAGAMLATLGSYTPIFAVAGCAYLVALGIIQLLSPALAPVEEDSLLD
ncbi:MAG: MFS transporter [Sphingomonas sp. 28-62-20]|uniref:MFS transporter n=1 Tax=Sphingomonas sp. 28-62-20 TaxID=1970433 RepID=UPI000BC499BA|nr:MAG: MFS transporter [Sphingomonas sp. 28-62-20]